MVFLARWRLLVGVGGGLASSLVLVKCAARLDHDKENGHVLPPDCVPLRKWDSNWDRMDPRFLKSKGWMNPNCTENKDKDNVKYPTARRYIYLIRHGQYHKDDPNDETATLTKLGEEQASLLGRRLASSGIKFTSITSSGMTRAIQTAEIMLKEMTKECPSLKLSCKDPILNEGAPCIPEPPFRNKELWDPDFNEFYVEGARIEAGFRKYFHRAEFMQKEDSFEIIVCHANVIRYFTMRALQFPPEGWLRLSLVHTSITRLSLLPEGDVILGGLGDSGHLPQDKLSA